MKKFYLLLILFSLFSACSKKAVGFEIGGMAARDDLSAPSQENTSEDFWKVDHQTSLFFFFDQPNSVGAALKPDTNLPAVLVIQGEPGFGSLRPWNATAYLTNDFVYYYYHRRGTGLSTISGSFESTKDLTLNFGLAQQIADIERIRGILAQEKLTIFAHGYGCFLAALYAIEFPENVSQMVLVSPSPLIGTDFETGILSPVSKESGFSAWKSEFLNLKNPENENLDYFEDRFRNYSDFWLSSISTNLSNDFESYFFRTKDNNGLNLLSLSEEASGGVAVLSHSSNISADVLVLYGESGTFFDSATALELCHSIPNASCAMISNCGDYPFDENAYETAIQLEQFFSLDREQTNEAENE